MKKKISYKIVSLVFSVLVLCFVVAFYVVGWTEPPQPPPGCNPGDPGCDPPLNIGPTAQTKSGALRVGGLTSDFDSYLATQGGNVGIGTTGPSQKLDVSGQIRATDVCTTAGKCLSAGGGFGDWQTTDVGQVGGTGAALAHDTNYQAATDGFVVARVIAGHCGQGVLGYTGSTSPASTLRISNGSGYSDSGGGNSITLPVKKNEWWRVRRVRIDGVCWGDFYIYWRPIQ